MAEVANEYFCVKCGGPATKKALKALRDWKSAEPSAFGGLGTWRCVGKCTRGCVKVRRRKLNSEANA